MSSEPHTALVFAGQGCQYSGMAVEAIEAKTAFRRAMEELDAASRASGGSSVLGTLQRLGAPGAAPGGALIDSHLSIFCVQYAAACAVRRRGLQPRVVFGYSLGEIVALAVAGVLGVEDALTLVRRQAEVIERHVERGHLVAVLGGEGASSAEFLARHPGVELAAVNWPGHVVYAVPREAVAALEADAGARGALTFRLAVDYPFHSRRMEPARELLLESMAGLRFRTAATPFFSVTSASLRETADPLHVWRIIREPIDFPGAIRALGSMQDLIFVDSSPNASMKLMIAKNLGGRARVTTAFDPFRGGRFML